MRVNWAAQREQKVDTTSHFHIFVGDLAPEINDRALLEAFSVIPTCSDARVVWDHTTGRYVDQRTVGCKATACGHAGSQRVLCRLLWHS